MEFFYHFLDIKKKKKLNFFVSILVFREFSIENNRNKICTNCRWVLFIVLNLGVYIFFSRLIVEKNWTLFFE